MNQVGDVESEFGDQNALDKMVGSEKGEFGPMTVMSLKLSIGFSASTERHRHSSRTT